MTECGRTNRGDRKFENLRSPAYSSSRHFSPHTDFKILLLLCWPAKSLVVAVTDGGGLTICAKASGPEKRALRRYFGSGAFSAVSTWVSCGKYDVAALRRCGLGRRQLPFQQQQGSRSFRIPAALTITPFGRLELEAGVGVVFQKNTVA